MRLSGCPTGTCMLKLVEEKQSMGHEDDESSALSHTLSPHKQSEGHQPAFSYRASHFPSPHLTVEFVFKLWETGVELHWSTSG
jgi:hypothetical protein